MRRTMHLFLNMMRNIRPWNTLLSTFPPDFFFGSKSLIPNFGKGSTRVELKLLSMMCERDYSDYIIRKEIQGGLEKEKGAFRGAFFRLDAK